MKVLLLFLLITISTHIRCDEEVLIAKGDHHYSPYEFLNEKDKPDGFNIEIFRAITDIMELNTKLSLEPWEKIRNELESGKIDIITGMYYSSQRDSLVDFSLPHIIVSHTIFVRKNSKIKSISDLQNKQILVQKNDIMHDYVIQHKFSDSIITVQNPIDALQLLSTGKYDCALLANLQGRHLIEQNNLENLTTTKDLIAPREYCFAVQEGNSLLVSGLNEGLNIIKTNGTYDRIYKKWFGIHESSQQSLQFIKYSIIVIIAIIIFFFFTFLWNLSLKNRVKEKTVELARVNKKLQSDIAKRQATEKALANAREDWEVIFQAIGHPSMILDKDHHILHANKATLKLFNTDIEHLQDKFCFKLLHLQNAPPENCPAEDLKKGKITTNEMVIEALDKVFLVTCTPILDEEGNLDRIIHIATDITKLKKTQEALRQKELLLNSTERLTKFGGWEWDIEKQQMFWTEETYRIHQIDPHKVKNGSQELIEQSLRCYSEEDRPKIKAAFEKCVSDGVPYDLECKITTQKGKKLWIRTAAKAVEQNGEIVKIFGNFGDISEIRQAREELEKHRDHLEDMVKERTRELEARNKELEKFNKLFIGRELRIKELKDKVRSLKDKLAKLT